MKLSRWMGVVAVCAITVVIHGTAAASSWRVAAFEGKSVSLVVVRPSQSSELAVVADGRLELSHDGGIMWNESLLPLQARSLVYDPVTPGVLYAGTDAGLYVTADGGRSWRLLESSLTSHKIISSLFAAPDYLYAAAWDGAGTPVRVLRFTREGQFIDTAFPDANPKSFDYDPLRHRLYAGSGGGVYYSDNAGAAWNATGPGAGQLTVSVAVKPGAIWQLSADGLFRSTTDGATWEKLAGPGNLNNTYYGNDMHVSGLAVGYTEAFYGTWSFSYPYKFLAEYDGSAARSVLDARIYDLAPATGSGRLWAATANGLWVNDTILTASLPTVQRPVIIVPGIMGSLPTSASLSQYFSYHATGSWGDTLTPLVLDPITHTYDSLITGLQQRGYTLDKTLFVFPYNWTQSNGTSAQELSAKIAAVHQICMCAQVDVVAHSMGGLVARSYIQSDLYRGDVRNLIEVATPNAGSLDSYPVWESGTYDELKPNFDNQLLNFLVSAWANDVSQKAKVDLIRERIPAIGQLLPIFSYITGRTYPGGYPTNPFLSSLNDPAAIQQLRQRVSLYEVGSESEATAQTLAVGAPTGQSVWPHGEIKSQTTGPGDNTVLRSSLEALGPASLLIGGDHHSVVGAAEPFIASTLMGGYVHALEQDKAASPENFQAVSVSNGAHLSITDADGHEVSDKAITFSGAYYSGDSLPTPIALIPMTRMLGSYRITVKSDRTGSVTLVITLLTHDPKPQQPSSRIMLEISPEHPQQFILNPISQTLAPVPDKEPQAKAVASDPYANTATISSGITTQPHSNEQPSEFSHSGQLEKFDFYRLANTDAVVPGSVPSESAPAHRHTASAGSQPSGSHQPGLKYSRRASSFWPLALVPLIALLWWLKRRLLIKHQP